MPDDARPFVPDPVAGVRIAGLADDSPYDSLDGVAPADVAAVVALWEACGLTRPWNPPERDLADALASPASTVLVARASGDDAAGVDPTRGGPGDVASGDGTSVAGTVVGTVLAGYDGHRGWLYYLAVAPGLRGAGIARALVAAAEAWLAERGARKVQLMVRRGNPAASLYPHLGYEPQDTEVYGRWL